MHPSNLVLDTLKHVKSYIALKLPLLNLEGKAQQLCEFLSMKFTSLSKCVTRCVKQSYNFLVYRSNPLVVQLAYFLTISFAGFLALKNIKPKGKPGPKDLDLMFTSVSTITVSSMATVEMEDLSDQQLWVLILLMLLGGEVFTSMLGLYFNNARANRRKHNHRSLHSISMDIESNSSVNNGGHSEIECGQSEETMSHSQVQQTKNVTHNPRIVLAHVVTGYFISTVVSGSVIIIIYFWIDSDARDILKSKEINIYTFSIFTAVSSFANCGFTPLNSNMQPFRKSWILLLLVIPQILAGNTLFSPLLRLSVWALGKVSRKEEYSYILQHPENTGYKHLHVQRNSVYMALNVTGLILLQVMFICSFESGSKTLEGMNWLQKLVGSLFQSVNTRQAGEAVVDISTFSPPTLLLFAVVMYLPSDASFLIVKADNRPLTDNMTNSISRAKRRNFTVTKLACLATFTFLACITESKSMSADPLNFNIFSIAFEMISAFGNVGYSLGFNCQKLLKPDSTCKAVSYGFVGRWTNEGKLIVILVMFLGRLKTFILKGREA